MNKYEIELEKIKEKNVSLDLTRGKPCKEQLDLSLGMMDALSSSSDLKDIDGIDCRNYGVLDGIDECKKLLADIIEVDPSKIIIYGNSSLAVMYSLISKSFTHGVLGNTPWSKLNKVKWLCPVPGYDRHFSICEYFGIEMINIPLKEDGPDMDLVEEYIKDPSVKGIWCVPKYSNPSGVCYSDEVVRRFAKLKPAAIDFRIYWDNAYSVHHLYRGEEINILEIVEECEKAGNPNLVYKFTSTSKISFPGSGIAALASSIENINDIKNQLKYETIGFDKVNQLRHVRFFKNLDGVKCQMKKHADIIRPKFDLVEKIFSEELQGFCSWNHPLGGYFISLEVKGHASQIIKRCKEVGLKLTEAGSSFPYHKDPENSNIRIAPTYPSMEELSLAIKILCLAIKAELYEENNFIND